MHVSLVCILITNSLYFILFNRGSLNPSIIYELGGESYVIPFTFYNRNFNTEVQAGPVALYDYTYFMQNHTIAPKIANTCAVAIRCSFKVNFIYMALELIAK